MSASREPGPCGGRARGRGRRRRRRVGPGCPDRRPRAGRRPARGARSWPIRCADQPASPPASSARSWPATCCGSPPAVSGARTGGSRVGWPTDAFLAAARGRRRVRQPRPRRAGRRPAGSPRRPASRWPPWPSCRSLTGRDILRVGIGLCLLLTGALLVRVGLGGTPTQLEQLLTAGLVARSAGRGGPGGRGAAPTARTGFAMSRSSPGRRSTSRASDAAPRTDHAMSLLALRRRHVRHFAGLAIVAPAAGRRRRPSSGSVGLVAAVVAAVAIDPAQAVADRRTAALATTAYVRLFLVLGSLVGLGLAVAGPAAGSRRDAPAVTLGDPRRVRADARPRRRAGRRPGRDGRRPVRRPA